jgi:death on curing protein
MATVWLTQELVAAFHLRQLSEHGGGTGLRDLGLLDSALQRPRQKVSYSEPDLSDLAAAYAYGIARNHPFIDGNKRTALVASFTFLYLNGYKVSSSQAENVTVFFALAEGTLSEEEIAAWFRQNIVAIG